MSSLAPTIDSCSMRSPNSRRCNPRLVLSSPQRGMVTIATALLMVALLGIAALAVDVGHLLVVRAQTQNAVDAAALRGASLLYTNGSSTPDFSATGAAVTGATQALALNLPVTAADTLTIQANYWQQLNPAAASNPAAIQVTLVKQTPLFFAQIFGKSSSKVSATAVGIVQSPTTLGPGATHLPLAIGACMYSLFWNSQTNQPQIDPSTQQPYIIHIGSYYSGSQDGMDGSSCPISAQWTGLVSNQVESDSALNAIITNGNSSTLAVSDSIWLANGTMNDLYQSVYDSVNSCSASGNTACEYSTVPVVGTVSPGSDQVVSALACLHVLSASYGSTKTVTVQMSGGCTPNNASGSGPSYGVVGPALLLLAQ